MRGEGEGVDLRVGMDQLLQDARLALDRIGSFHVDSEEANKGTLAALSARAEAAEAKAEDAAQSVVRCTSQLATDAASRRALLSAAEEARAGMEAELWCIAAVLEEKERCVGFSWQMLFCFGFACIAAYNN